MYSKETLCIVILIDDKHIDKITDNMIDRANNEALPLFIMPWDIKLIDIIQEIFLKIEQKERKQKMVSIFLNHFFFTRSIK